MKRRNVKQILIMLLIVVVSLIVSPATLQATEQKGSFKDVAISHWAHHAIQQSIHLGIVEGYQDSTFRPNANVSPVEFIVMFYRTYKTELALTEDNDQNWKSPYINLAQHHSWDIDVEQSILNRGEVARFIYSVLQQETVNEYTAITFMLNQGYSDGLTSATVDGYGADALLTRAQAVVFLQNIKQNVSNLADYHFADGYYSETKEGQQQIEEHEQENVNQNKSEEDKFFADVTLRDISIGYSVHELVSKLGEPDRQHTAGNITYYTYNAPYSQYALYYINNNKVEGMYSNAKEVWSSSYLATIGNDPAMGKPIPETISVEYYTDSNERGIVEGILVESSIRLSLSETLTKQDEIEVAKQNLDMTNVYRDKYDVAPLEWHEQLAETAYDYSVYMYKNNHFAHDSKDGFSPFDRMRSNGISYRAAGENIAFGYRDAIDVTNGWINSPGHRKNMLNSSFDSLGVGVHQYYYTQNFIGN